MKLRKFDPEMRFGFVDWINCWHLKSWKWMYLCEEKEVIKFGGVCLDIRGNGSYAWSYESQWARGGAKGQVVPGRLVEGLDICFNDEVCHWGQVAYAPSSVECSPF